MTCTRVPRRPGAGDAPDGRQEYCTDCSVATSQPCYSTSSPGENRCLHPLDEPGGQGVTAFGNSLPSFQAPSLSQKSDKRLVNTHIGVDAELAPEFQKKFHFWNFGPAVPRVTISSNADYV